MRPPRPRPIDPRPAIDDAIPARPPPPCAERTRYPYPYPAPRRPRPRPRVVLISHLSSLISHLSSPISRLHWHISTPPRLHTPTATFPPPRPCHAHAPELSTRPPARAPAAGSPHAARRKSTYWVSTLPVHVSVRPRCCPLLPVEPFHAPFLFLPCMLMRVLGLRSAFCILHHLFVYLWL